VKDSKSRRRGYGILRRAERALWITGVALVTLCAAGIAHRGLMQRHDAKAFERARELHIGQRSGAATASLEAPPPDRQEWSVRRIEEWERAQIAEVGLPLALLRIPAVDLAVAVHRGTDALSLNRGVGWIPGTARPGMPGNVAIAGHRDGFFRSLRGIENGDRIELQTIDGSHVYEVQEHRIVSPEDVEVLQPTAQSAITLVTCYPFYWIGSAPQRYIVRGRRLEFEPAYSATGDVDDDTTPTAAPRRRLPDVAGSKERRGIDVSNQ